MHILVYRLSNCIMNKTTTTIGNDSDYNEPLSNSINEQLIDQYTKQGFKFDQNFKLEFQYLPKFSNGAPKQVKKILIIFSACSNRNRRINIS